VPADHALLAAGAGVVLCGSAAYALAPWILRRLPEPEPEVEPEPEAVGELGAAADSELVPEPEVKTLYVDLAGAKAAYWCGGLAAVAGGLLGWSLGMSAGLAAWLILAVSGALLGYIDAHTRYLPSLIIWPTYGAVAVALVIGAAASGEWDMLRRAAIAGAIGFAVFYLMWLVFPRGVGFGDVRLSGLLSLALGWIGWAELISGLYGGFLLGAVIGLLLMAVRLVKLKQLLPFGPFMLVGALLGVLLGEPLQRLYLG
jgi:leader peptidase (prepilin peptidase)/N-methyltransferase